MNFLNKLISGGTSQLNIEGYLESYYEQDNHVLIDVRTEAEYKSGHLPGAKNIPLNEVGSRLSEIPKEQTIVLVCQSGNRSNFAARTLMQAGYETVINLQGGTVRWRGLGYPVK